MYYSSNTKPGTTPLKVAFTVYLMSILLPFCGFAELPPDAVQISTWTKQMLQGSKAARAGLITYANDESKDDLMRQIALRSIGLVLSRENVAALKPFLLSASDGLRTTAYHTLPGKVRQTLAFDFTKQPTQEEYDQVAAQIDQVAFSDVVEAMESHDVPQPFVVTADSEAQDAPAWKAFDDQGKAQRSWRTVDSVDAVSVSVDLGDGQARGVTRYAIHASGDSAPRDWKLMGSTDGSTWVSLATVSGYVIWAESSEARYFTANQQSQVYRHYRLSVTANNGGTSVAIHELELFE